MCCKRANLLLANYHLFQEATFCPDNPVLNYTLRVSNLSPGDQENLTEALFQENNGKVLGTEISLMKNSQYSFQILVSSKNLPLETTLSPIGYYS